MIEARPNPPGRTEEVLVALRRIIRAIELRSRELAHDCGLTGPQLGVLKQVHQRERPSVSDLAKALHLSHATVADVLERLEKRGLVQRTRSQADRRRLELETTERAEALLADAPPLLQEHFTERFAALEDWEQTLMLSSLQRIVALMEAADISAGPILATGSLTTEVG